MNGFTRNLLPAFNLNPQQVQPTNGTDVINNATNTAIQQGIDQHNVNQINQQASDLANKTVEVGQALGLPMDYTQYLAQAAQANTYKQGILGSKLGWQEQAEAGNQAGMDAYAKQADYWRQAAEQNGYDVSNYGSGVSLNDAQSAFAIDNANIYTNTIASPDSATYYDQMTDYWRSQGVSGKNARRYAQQDAAKYQQNRLNALQQSLFTIGLNERGGLNEQGVQIMNMMYDENPDSISYLQQAVPTLVQEYAYQTSEAQKDNELQRQYGLLGVQNNYKLSDLAAETQAKMALQDNEGNNKLQQIATQGNYDLAKAGTRGGSGSGQSSGSMRDLLAIVKAEQQWNDNHPEADPEDNPYTLMRAQYESSGSADGGTIDTGKQRSLGDFDGRSSKDMYSLFTTLLEKGKQLGLTKDDIQRMMRDKTEMADSIMANVDWSSYGY